MQNVHLRSEGIGEGIVHMEAYRLRAFGIEPGTSLHVLSQIPYS